MIADIGIVGQCKETDKNIVYLAPETLAKKSYVRTKASDIYSFGIMMWEMWYGDLAFEEHMPVNKDDFLKIIVKGGRPKRQETEVAPLPPIEETMQFCWHSKAAERLSAKECLNNFQEIFNKKKHSLSPTNHSSNSTNI